MLSVKLIAVGKIKEPFYIAAIEEYKKRLSAFSNLEIVSVPEEALSPGASPEEISAALFREGGRIEKHIPRGAFVFALCIEGKMLSSVAFSRKIEEIANRGISKIAFVIGGSNGICGGVKDRADFALSMSDMTFAHHLAQVMLLEQLYRAFSIIEGGKYHK